MTRTDWKAQQWRVRATARVREIVGSRPGDDIYVWPRPYGLSYRYWDGDGDGCYLGYLGFRDGEVVAEAGPAHDGR